MLPSGVIRQQLGVALWKLVVLPITVHGMGPCLLLNYGLPYVSLGSVTVSTGEHSLPVSGVVVSGDVICYG